MRVFFFLVAIIVVLGWFAFEHWNSNRQLAQVLVAFAAVFAVLLVGAFFSLY